MTFLRILFWIVIAALALIFASSNWTPISVTIGNGLLLDTTLGALVLFAVLLGLLPALAARQVDRWRFRRRIAELERRGAIADDAADPVENVDRPFLRPTTTPAPAGVPTAVPPGVA